MTDRAFAENRFGLGPRADGAGAGGDPRGWAAAQLARFEPRLAGVRVRVETAEGAADVVRSPVTLVIEGELWGYPLAENLRVRTVLDLEEGKAVVEGAAA